MGHYLIFLGLLGCAISLGGCLSAEYTEGAIIPMLLSLPSIGLLVVGALVLHAYNLKGDAIGKRLREKRIQRASGALGNSEKKSS